MKRAALAISAEEKDFPDQLRQSRTAPVRDVQRAQILWRYQCGEKVAVIVRALNTTCNSVLKWIDKALQLGVVAGIRHTPHTPRQAVITDDAKTWMVHLACSKPKDPGYAAELWTRSALAGHVRSESVGAGFPALKNAGKATVQRILAAPELQPHKVRHYLERRDPFPASIRRLPATMSTSGMARCRFWQPLICSTAMLQRESKSVTEASAPISKKGT
jgi:hypothetical protein